MRKVCLAQAPTAAAFLTGLLSLAVSRPGLLRASEPPAPSAFSLRPEAVREGEVHRLVAYIFVYDDVISLACGAVVIWVYASSFEKNVGTAKHCFFTLAFAVAAALLYLLLRTLVSGLAGAEDAKGFTPVAFAMLGVSTTRSRMRRTLFLGISTPIILVPWLLLGPAWFIPHSSFLCNICGILVGEVYGLGYCSRLDLPESLLSRLDHKLPFSILKRIPGLQYIPGSSAERSASLSRKITPVPGSYPTQSYYCTPPPALPLVQMQQSNAQSVGSWPHYTPGRIHPPVPNQTSSTFGEFYVQNHFGPSPGYSCQPADSCPPPYAHLLDSQTPKGTENLEATFQPTPGLPTVEASSDPAELSRVQIY
uniref:Rhomboid domain containing 2 n=1 Tax=Sphenodon punctatus TaxID=8508 RepID=A0A8D0L4D9_SPHPU